MYIKYDISLTDFDFWAGAKENVKILTMDELRDIETFLEGLYMEMQEIPTETEINDFMWFEVDIIAQICNYNDWDELFEDRKNW